MLATLSAWSSRCTSTLGDLERQIASIRAEAARRNREEQEWNAHVEKLLESKVSEGAKTEDAGRFGLGKRGAGKRMGNGSGGSGGGGGLTGDGWEEDDMDVDYEDIEDEKRGKKRGFGSLSFGK